MLLDLYFHHQLQAGDAGRPRRWYVQRKKSIYVFDSAQDADNFVAADAAQDAIEQAQKTSRKARPPPLKTANPVQPAESVDIDYIGALVDRYQMAIDLPRLIVNQDYERILEIMAQALQLQDEDDIELLLLA